MAAESSPPPESGATPMLAILSQNDMGRNFVMRLGPPLQVEGIPCALDGEYLAGLGVDQRDLSA